MLKRTSAPYTALVVALVASCCHLCWAAATVSVTTDRADAIYHCGEEATFAVAVADNGSAVKTGQVSYTLTLDGGAQVAEGTLDLQAEPVAIKGTLAEPGLLRCTVTYPAADKPVTALAAAAFDPDRIVPTARMPYDFARFWTLKKRKLARVPLDAKLTKSEAHSSQDATVYKISLANIHGSRVYGWLGVPTRKSRYPAILTVPAAGVYPIPAGWVDWAKRGYIAMGISIHNYDVDLPKETYDELSRGCLAGYPHKHADSRHSFYFLRAYLGCVRAIDYLTSRDDWDGCHVIVTGSSQGGGLSIITAGLDARVTAIASNVPALCDLAGALHGRPSGWPHLPVGNDARVASACAYYDAVNFARYVTCPTLMSVGFIDTTCPPMTVYSAFNVIPGPKTMVPTPTMGHSQSKEYSDLLDKWIPLQAFGPPLTLRMRDGDAVPTDPACP